MVLSLRVRRANLWLLWLLTVLLPLQGMIVGVLKAVGPSHVHAQNVQATGAPEAFLAHEHEAADDADHDADLDAEDHDGARGHTHGDGAAERHHHPHGDASVVLVGSDAQGDEESGISPGLAAFLALLHSAAPWSAVATGDTWGAHVPWQARTHAVEPPERPPRPA